MKSLSIVLLAVIFCNSTQHCQDKYYCKDTLIKNIQAYEQCDAEICENMPSVLMRAYIYNDSLFLSCMTEHQLAFQHWIHSFNMIFTMYECGDDSIEVKLHTAYFDKMKELAISASYKKYNNPGYNTLQTVIANELKKVKISAID